MPPYNTSWTDGLRMKLASGSLLKLLPSVRCPVSALAAWLSHNIADTINIFVSAETHSIWTV